MVSNNTCRSRGLRITVGIASLILILMLSLTTNIAAAPAGAPLPWIWSLDKNPAVPYIWNSYNFDGFYYDLKYDISTEELILYTPPATLAADRTIPKNSLVYTTHGTPMQFKANEKENVTVDGDATFALEGWQAEKWIAVKGISNKIAKLAFEMGKEDKKTLTTGETWVLGAGYELTINTIDANTNPKQVWFTLKKNGTVIDEGIGQAPASGSYADKQKAVYFKKKTILGESDALLFTVYISNIISNAVEFKYAWLIDESSALEVKSPDRYGVFEVRSASYAQIMMDNENTVSLSKNTEATIMGNLKFSIADNDSLRFYPYVEPPTSGAYEVGGTVVQESTPGLASWDAYNFAGFYYDLKHDRTTEKLSLLDTVSALKADRTIQKNQLVYKTHSTPVDFKVFEKEGVGITNSNDTQYPVVGWMGEKWIAVDDDCERLVKLAFEMGKEDKKTLTTGETWVLGAGYELIINTIDANTNPKKVRFTLKKNGTVVDEAIGQAPISGSVADKQKAVYYKTKTILPWKYIDANSDNVWNYPETQVMDKNNNGIYDQGEPYWFGFEPSVGAPLKELNPQTSQVLFTVYVDSIFSNATSDMVQFKYAWLIDENTAQFIMSSDRFGVFEVRTASDAQIIMDNENTVSLSKNTEATLMGNLKFKIADNDTLRFYPKVDYAIPVSPTPSPTSTPIPTTTPAPTSTPTPTPTPTVTPTPTPNPTTVTPTPTPIPTGYDTNGNGIIDKNEAVQAVIDYFNGTITKQNALNVVLAYFGG